MKWAILAIHPEGGEFAIVHTDGDKFFRGAVNDIICKSHFRRLEFSSLEEAEQWIGTVDKKRITWTCMPLLVDGA